MSTRMRQFTPSSAYEQVLWRVTCEDSWGDGTRVVIRMPASGPQDAMNRVRLEYPDLRPLRAVRA